MTYFKKRTEIDISDIETVVEQENGNGWDLADFEKASGYQKRDLYFRRGNASFQAAVGNTFRCHHVFTVGNGESGYIQFSTGAKYAFINSLIVTPETELFTERFLADPDFTAGSSPLASSNANHNSNKTTTVTLDTAPTEVSGGTEFESVYMPGESGIGQNRRGDRYAGNVEWVLQPNTDHILEIQNNGAGGGDVNIELSWFEMSE